jgi:GT2 family glycosyltransferase
VRPDVSALIVTWNNEATLTDCLGALRRELPPGGEILVFDNHSVDDSPRIAQRCGARTEVHDSNLGFAAGMNRLAAGARGNVLLVVNPDAFLHPGSVLCLLRHLSNGSERKIVGGLLRSTSGEPELASARPFPTAAALARWLLTRRRATWPIPTTAQEVPAISGAFFATTRDLWRELDGFDEAYRHSGEDLDLCWRAAGIGASVWFEPGAEATHLSGASVRQAPLQLDALRLSGALRLVRAREGVLAAALLRGVLLLRSLLALGLDTFRVHRLSGPRRRRAWALVTLALLGEHGSRLQLPVEPERAP